MKRRWIRKNDGVGQEPSKEPSTRSKENPWDTKITGMWNVREDEVGKTVGRFVEVFDNAYGPAKVSQIVELILSDWLK